MTVLFDHDVIDGAPVARFIRRMGELIEDGYCLEELVPEARTARENVVVHS